MNVHISYRDRKTPDIEKDINHLVEKLRKRLQVFRPELVHLKGVVEQNSPREGTTVSLNLRLPSGQMAVQKSASTASSAVKAAFDDLLQQVSKHKDLLRNSHKWQRRRVADFRPQSAGCIRRYSRSRSRSDSFLRRHPLLCQRQPRPPGALRRARTVFPGNCRRDHSRRHQQRRGHRRSHRARVKQRRQWSREAGKSGAGAVALPPGAALHR